jgi:hypothetical protein
MIRLRVAVGWAEIVCPEYHSSDENMNILAVKLLAILGPQLLVKVIGIGLTYRNLLYF